ncbi:hypothetical protein Halha_0344 [Halobacteroides halobius DSM 5150]|uniref:Uncharacterized protein n=1 Tax=Halobacteroides halobius (strain ATCC 35273 / DSM 5150 / MD-1) TaxID=748449 RepID=L0K745_HALHC|nr:hypothetical protein [Halobacteroides halobius]AGB40350.1 hypothetical protein Halha_0344 [Halobacteroides halobius DSM 5150]
MKKTLIYGLIFIAVITWSTSTTLAVDMTGKNGIEVFGPGKLLVRNWKSDNLEYGWFISAGYYDDLEIMMPI